MKQLSIALLVVTAAAVTAPAQETVANPLYDHWAKFGPGTYVVMESVSKVAGNETTSSITYTLKEVTKDKVVLEMKTAMVLAGKSYEQPPTKTEFPARVPKQPAPKKDAPKPKEGKEKIEVLGKKLECQWIETVFEANGMKTTSRTWTNDDVPGMTVKSVSTSKGAMEMNTEMRVKKFEVKKR